MEIIKLRNPKYLFKSSNGISDKCEPRRPWSGSTIILCHAKFKNLVLQHTEGLMPFVLISTVSICSEQNLCGNIGAKIFMIHKLMPTFGFW